MKRLIISYSIRPETYERLKLLAEQDNRSASEYLDRLVEKAWNLANIPEPITTETPAGE